MSQPKYPETIVGMYKNNFSEKFTLNSLPLDQERADQMCAAIQKCVGGRIELKTAGGISKNGKKLPDFFLEGLTSEILAERKAFGATKKAERDDDQSL
jgi:hypothetical protein